MKTYRPYHPDQTYLLPPSTREWLPEGHLAYFILDVVEELDLSAIEARIQEKDPRGERPYAPRMMVALLLYAYCSGVYSSRRIARATWEDVPFRVLSGEQHPHWTTINAFRLEHLDALAGLFKQVLQLCREAGLVQLGHIAVDGTKLQANASKHKAMSYERMKSTSERLDLEIAELLDRAKRIDEAEDEEFGRDKDGTELPEDLTRRQSRKKRIREAMDALKAEAAAARALELKEQAARHRAKAEASEDPVEREKAQSLAAAREATADALGADPEAIPGSGTDLPFNRVPHEQTGEPKPKAQRNFTDPESRIMKTGGTYLQGYNGQIAVDEANQIVLAHALTNQAPDVEHLRPLLDQVERNVGSLPRQLTADAGYWDDDLAADLDHQGVDAYIATRRQHHGERTEPPETPPPPDAVNQPSPKQKMQEKVQSEEGQMVYSKRKWVVEPVFGQMKEVRRFRRLSLRGLRKARGEFALVLIAHNLLKLKRSTD